MTDSNGKDSPTFILECQARAAGFYEVDFGLDSRIDELRGVHRIVSDILQSLAASPRMPKRVLKAPAGSEQRPDRLVQAWIKSTWANLELLAPAFRAFPQLTCLSHTLSSGPIHLRSQVLRRSSLTLSALQQILPLLGQKPVADQARCVLIAILSGISRYSPDSASALLLALSRTLDDLLPHWKLQARQHPLSFPIRTDLTLPQSPGGSGSDRTEILSVPIQVDDLGSLDSLFSHLLNLTYPMLEGPSDWGAWAYRDGERLAHDLSFLDTILHDPASMYISMQVLDRVLQSVLTCLKVCKRHGKPRDSPFLPQIPEILWGLLATISVILEEAKSIEQAERGGKTDEGVSTAPLESRKIRGWCEMLASALVTCRSLLLCNSSSSTLRDACTVDQLGYLGRAALTLVSYDWFAPSMPPSTMIPSDLQSSVVSILADIMDATSPSMWRKMHGDLGEPCLRFIPRLWGFPEMRKTVARLMELLGRLDRQEVGLPYDMDRTKSKVEHDETALVETVTDIEESSGSTHSLKRKRRDPGSGGSGPGNKQNLEALSYDIATAIHAFGEKQSGETPRLGALIHLLSRPSLPSAMYDSFFYNALHAISKGLVTFLACIPSCKERDSRVKALKVGMLKFSHISIEIWKIRWSQGHWEGQEEERDPLATYSALLEFLIHVHQDLKCPTLSESIEDLLLLPWRPWIQKRLDQVGSSELMMMENAQDGHERSLYKTSMSFLPLYQDAILKRRGSLYWDQGVVSTLIDQCLRHDLPLAISFLHHAWRYVLLPLSDDTSLESSVDRSRMTMVLKWAFKILSEADAFFRKKREKGEAARGNGEDLLMPEEKANLACNLGRLACALAGTLDPDGNCHWCAPDDGQEMKRRMPRMGPEIIAYLRDSQAPLLTLGASLALWSLPTDGVLWDKDALHLPYPESYLERVWIRVLCHLPVKEVYEEDGLGSGVQFLWSTSRYLATTSHAQCHTEEAMVDMATRTLARSALHHDPLGKSGFRMLTRRLVHLFDEQDEGIDDPGVKVDELLRQGVSLLRILKETWRYFPSGEPGQQLQRDEQNSIRACWSLVWRLALTSGRKTWRWMAQGILLAFPKNALASYVLREDVAHWIVHFAITYGRHELELLWDSIGSSSIRDFLQPAIGALLGGLVIERDPTSLAMAASLVQKRYGKADAQRYMSEGDLCVSQAAPILLEVFLRDITELGGNLDGDEDGDASVKDVVGKEEGEERKRWRLEIRGTIGFLHGVLIHAGCYNGAEKDLLPDLIEKSSSDLTILLALALGDKRRGTRRQRKIIWALSDIINVMATRRNGPRETVKEHLSNHLPAFLVYTNKILMTGSKEKKDMVLRALQGIIILVGGRGIKPIRALLTASLETAVRDEECREASLACWRIMFNVLFEYKKEKIERETKSTWERRKNQDARHDPLKQGNQEGNDGEEEATVIHAYCMVMDVFDGYSIRLQGGSAWKEARRLITLLFRLFPRSFLALPWRGSRLLQEAMSDDETDHIMPDDPSSNEEKGGVEDECLLSLGEKHESSVVVKRVLIEIYHRILQGHDRFRHPDHLPLAKASHDGFIQSSNGTMDNEEVVSRIEEKPEIKEIPLRTVRLLLQSTLRYHGQDESIVDWASRGLGAIGMVDPVSVQHRLECLGPPGSNERNQDDGQENGVAESKVYDLDTSLGRRAWVREIIIEELGPAFRASKDAGQQQYIAYTLQTLLKALGWTRAVNRADDEVGRKVTPAEEALLRRSKADWESLPGGIREAIHPLLTSKYYLREEDEDEGGAMEGVPVFHQVASHPQWVNGWLRRMWKVLRRGKDPRKIRSGGKEGDVLEDEGVEGWLRLLWPAIRHGTHHLGSRLLPHLALHVLTGAWMHQGSTLSESSRVEEELRAREIILDEMVAVLSYFQHQNATLAEDPRQRFNMDKGWGGRQRLAKECAHTVFCILRLSEGWVQRRRRQEEGSRRDMEEEREEEEEEEERRMGGVGGRTLKNDQGKLSLERTHRARLKVEGAMKLIRYDLITQAAKKCGAYTRALMKQEELMRQSLEGRKNQEGGPVGNQGFFQPEADGTWTEEELNDLLGIYASLGDEDGVDGVSALTPFNPHRVDEGSGRRKGWVLKKRALEQEARGKWRMAEVSLDMLLSLDEHVEGGGDEEEEDRRSLVRNLMISGDYPRVVDHALSHRVKKRKWLNNMASEACWRMGQWDALDELIGDSQPHNVSGKVDQGFKSDVWRVVENQVPGLEARHMVEDESDATSAVAHALVALRQHMEALDGEQRDGKKDGHEHIHVPGLSMTLAALRRQRLLTPLALTLDGVQAEGGSLWTGYQRASSRTLPHLHALFDIEQYARMGSMGEETNGSINRVEALAAWMRQRRVALGPTYVDQERLLTLHRTLASLSWKRETLEEKEERRRLQVDLALEHAKLARQAGFLEVAEASILSAFPLASSSLVDHLRCVVEDAKLIWSQGDQTRALRILKEGMRLVHVGLSTPPDVNPEVKAQWANMSLRYCRWTEEMGLKLANTMTHMYDQAARQAPEREKAYFYCGRYFNILYESSVIRDRGRVSRGSSTGGKYSSTPASSSSYTASPNLSSPRSKETIQTYRLRFHVCKMYVKALTCGRKYIDQTISRFITLWLTEGWDGISGGMDVEDPDGPSINQMVAKYVDKLPVSHYYYAFSQILSRIGHEDVEAYGMLERMILRVMRRYPFHAMWWIAPVRNSDVAIRKDRCQALINRMKQHLRDGGMGESWGKGVGEGPGWRMRVERMVEAMDVVPDTLIQLSKFSIPARGGKPKTFSLNLYFRELARMTPLEIMIPTQEAMLAPTNRPWLSSAPNSEDHLVTIFGFKDEVMIMTSLVHPKRLRIVGSDGKIYVFLVKPKDDLRKDSRLMEFNSMINRLLNSDVETRRRKMHIRTYAVLPLSAACGLIEWVRNTEGVRLILNKYYTKKNITISNREIMRILDDNPQQRGKAFVKRILPRIPPIFHEWFIDTFPDPERWYAARKAYSVTLAVMSMIGYIVGLGDRHGENILIDSTNGEAVHVDLNCLFERGKSFEWPELVPFRLTQNLVAALGVTGVEGTFRKTCEETVRVVRENEASLMCILETFVHDPLVEWGKQSKGSRTSTESEGRRKARTNRDGLQDNRARYDRAIKVLRTIEKKIRGEILHVGLNLSEKGQVDELIRQAVDPDNLAKMYIGWAPFL